MWQFVRKIAGVGAVISALSAPAWAQTTTEIEVGYMPIMAVSQLFVMEGEGWDKAAGLSLKKTRFSDGPAIVQALASGKLDVVYFGIGPAMVAKANGIDIRVVASNVMEQTALIARGDLAKYMEGTDAKTAVAKFTAEKGHKPKIASLPKGSVPDTVLRYWLLKNAGLTENDVEILGMGASRVQQALLAGSVDAASILEPVLTIVLDRDATARVIVYGSEMLQDQPGAVMAVRSDFIKKHPDVVQKLVELHTQATAVIVDDPKRAAKHVHAAIGRGLIPIQLLERAIVSPYAKYSANPHSIIASTKAMHDFQAEIGALRKPVPLDQLFDTTYYDVVVGPK